MSFVGIMHSRHGIVGIADSKSTFEIGNHGLKEDQRSVRKIFKSEQFILVMAGKNQYIEDNKMHPVCSLTELLLKNFTGTHREFTEQLYGRLSETFYKNPDIEYKLIYGFREDWSNRMKPEWGDTKIFYGAEWCILNRFGIHYEVLKYNPDFEWMGTDAYVPRNIYVGEDWNVTDMKECCSAIMDFIVKMGDRFLPYNSVGREIIMEELV